jgi:hypothetical protein
VKVYTEWSEFTVKRDTTVATCRLYTVWVEVAVQTPAAAVGGWSVGTIRF